MPLSLSTWESNAIVPSKITQDQRYTHHSNTQILPQHEHWHQMQPKFPILGWPGAGHSKHIPLIKCPTHMERMERGDEWCNPWRAPTIGLTIEAIIHQYEMSHCRHFVGMKQQKNCKTIGNKTLSSEGRGLFCSYSHLSPCCLRYQGCHICCYTLLDMYSLWLAFNLGWQLYVE